MVWRQEGRNETQSERSQAVYLEGRIGRMDLHPTISILCSQRGKIMTRAKLILFNLMWVIIPLLGCSQKPSTNKAVAKGSWVITVSAPHCDGTVKVMYPEREGDVFTVYCDDMPVGVK